MSLVLKWVNRSEMINKSDLSGPEIKNIITELLKVDYLCDAINLMVLSDAKEALNKALELVVDEGNFFLFKLASFNLEKSDLKDKLTKLIANAQKKGLNAYAKRAEDYLTTL